MKKPVNESTEPTEKKKKEKGYYEVITSNSDLVIKIPERYRSYPECLSYVKEKGEVGKTYRIIRVLKTITIKEVTKKVLVS